MSITSIPSQSESAGQLGKVKADGPKPYVDPNIQIKASHWNQLCQRVIEAFNEIGLSDGSTVGSLRKAINDVVSGLTASVIAVLAALTTATIGAGSGYLTLANDLIFAKRVLFQGIISPTTLSADQDDWNPTGIDTAAVVRIAATAARTITGIAYPGATGKVLFLHNISAYTLTLAGEDEGSGASSRFADTYYLGAGSSALAWYDTTSNRWRLVGSLASFAAMAKVGLVVGTPTLGVGASLTAQSGAFDDLVAGRFGLNVITPSALSSDQTDYAPTGLNTASHVQLQASSAGVDIRSMAWDARGADGTPLKLIQCARGSAYPITFKHDYTSGTTAAYRFSLPRARDMVLAPGESAWFFWDGDGVTPRWRVVSAPPRRQIANGGVAITASTYTIQPGDDIILVDTTSNACALTRPALGDGIERVIVKVAGGTNGITLVRLSSEKINGVAATYTLPGSTTAWASATPQGWMFFDDGTDTQVC